MKSVLLIQPSLQPPGGGNGVAARMIEALKRDFAVTALTWWPIHLDEINRHYGTALLPDEFSRIVAAPLLQRILDIAPLPLALLKNSFLLRFCKRIQSRYDVLISANNEVDFGRRGVQYVHFPWAYQPRPQLDIRAYHLRLAVDAYFRICVAVAGFSFDRMKRNVTLTNSAWTAGKMKERHGVDAATLFPPTPGGFPPIPWSEREPGFTCIGRISPEKEIEKVVDILAEVRRRGFPVHLHIVGTAPNRDYRDRVMSRAPDGASWVFLEENLSRAGLAQLVARHRFGIHGMSEEHFGIAVAEMLRAGCIPFAPAGGGPVEILGGDPRLLYRSAEDAVERIVAVLADPAAQESLRRSLDARADLFTDEAFAGAFRSIVAEMANGARA